MIISSIYLLRCRTINTTTDTIVIPASALNVTAYVFTLTLTNWFGNTKVQSAAVRVSDQIDLPIVSVLGAPRRVITVTDSLSLQALGSVASCSVSSELSYRWDIFKNYVFTGIKSGSADPSKLLLKPYSLQSGGPLYYCHTVTVISLLS